MDPLKDMFHPGYFAMLAKHTKAAHRSFDEQGFLRVVNEGLEARSLNERMRHAAKTLGVFLPEDYRKAVTVLKQVIPHMPGGYTNLLFPDFVAQYGISDYDYSMEALKYFTSFGSSEFAVREFLKRDIHKGIKMMEAWALDSNAHVRRLASEGSRPRLPWSFKLDAIIKSPELTATILQRLKTDEELYVRKSVANHLNDISKENSDYMIRVVKSWDLNHPHTAWIVKHASRSLIKKGDVKSLQIFNFEKNPKVKVEKLQLEKSKIQLGNTLQFSFDVVSEKKQTQKLVVDYVIHYRKKSGELSPKVFKLKELQLKGLSSMKVQKSQLIKDFTTRKHYPGKHLLEIQVNGKRLAAKPFHITH